VWDFSLGGSMQSPLIFSTWSDESISTPLFSVFTPAEIAHSFYTLSAGSSYAQKQTQYEDFIQNALNSRKNKSSFFPVVFLYFDTKILGFLLAQVLDDEVEIDFLCVDPLLRKQGIAQKLFHALEEKILLYLNGKKCALFLEVGEKNESAVLFYKKNGFEVVSKRTKYYKNTEDAYVMRKILQ
jgi:ribosomal protein S18 acetylase RimI-like enzyme